MNQTPTDFPADGDIVIFQPEFVEFGGEERVILSLSKALYAQGKAHAVLCYWDKINLAQYANWPLKVHQLNPGTHPVSKVWSLRRALARIHRAGSPTPVLFNIQSAYHAGLAASAPYHSRIPDTYSLLAYQPNGLRVTQVGPLTAAKRYLAETLRHVFTRRGIQKAQRFVTNTAALRKEMEALYGRNAEVIYLGGFGGPRQTGRQRDTQTIELLSVSRLQKSKRIDWMLRALADVQRNGSSYPQWRLHIAGTGPDSADLQALCKALGIANQVVFHGFVTDEALKALYADSHVFLMPAKQGYGLPAIEALYQKMGLVVSETSGVVEILGHTNWVAIAPDGEDGFAAALKGMLRRVAQPGFFDQALPDLPTEEKWAQQMVNYLAW